MANDLTPVKEKILQATDLAALIGEQVKLVRKSGRPMGLCPFHNEKTPSFYIYDRNYHCFGCKASGDAIDYVRHIHGFNFIEALRYLGQRAGIEVAELQESQAVQEQRRQANQLGRVLAQAQNFYAKELATPRGQSARDYLKGRGFSDEHIKEYGFGLTPEEGYGLCRELRRSGHREEELAACSLATKSTKDGRFFDFFRARLMIPIRDQQGRVVGFGGRTMIDHPAKYMNSREGVMFDKSSLLFGFDRAKPAIRNKQRAFVVEGYMDAMKLWSVGVEETVACLGTALTLQHLRSLRGPTSLVYLVFDGDQAGKKASLAAVDIALAVPEVEVRVVCLPAGEDPDSYVDQHGAQGFEALTAKASGLLEHAVRAEIGDAHVLAVPDIIAKRLVPWLIQIKDPVQRNYLAGRVAQISGVPLATIREQAIAARGGGQAANRRPQSETSPAPARIVPLTGESFELVGHLFFAEPGSIDPGRLRNFIRTEMELSYPWDQFCDDILTHLSEGVAAFEADRTLWSSLGAPEIAQLVERLYKAQRAFQCNDRRERIERLKAHIHRRRIKSAITALKQQMAGAAGGRIGDSDYKDLLEAITQLNQELKSLEQT